MDGGHVTVLDRDTVEATAFDCYSRRPPPPPPPSITFAPEAAIDACSGRGKVAQLRMDTDSQPHS